MSGLYLSKGLYPRELFKGTAQSILDTQLPDGLIPWFVGGHADPWDHVESAMGLSISGEYAAAERAYFWLRDNQLEDGSWWASYKNGEPENRERRESNFVSYVATGVWHHYLITEDREFLQAMWPTVKAAIDFALRLQTPHGDIHWAVNTDGEPMQDALVTGCSSIYKSLECINNIAITLDQPSQDYLRAREKLGDALRNKPERFDRTWESKARYSMDWFYPILTGVLNKTQANARLKARWNEFVEKDMGCRCVSDEPWVTVAESCELTMALLAAGDRSKAMTIYSWLHQWRLGNGEYWTGYQFEMDIMWPDEKPTWTAGAILLAADALTEHTPAHALFNKVVLLDDEVADAGSDRDSAKAAN